MIKTSKIEQLVQFLKRDTGDMIQTMKANKQYSTLITLIVKVQLIDMQLNNF